MITIAILTISDKCSKGEREDKSGQVISHIIKDLGKIKFYDIVPDEVDLIKHKLLQYCDYVDLIFTTGGTGLSPRDVTPEATKEVIQKEVPGIAEAMRVEGLKSTRQAILSRAIAGIRDKTLIINLPGSPKAVKECLEIIIDVIPHAIAKIKGDMSECAQA
ncbi:MAG: MogA/MoaB family molybdenum cofactor biosynthesis protein [Thermodesulfovibrionales bacterium]|nr:MogA/MoaB family molybdenum cofactor biosynthesis protein [Thermodesulfovibrionales bacterium]